jgi:hypothetical protein
MRQEVKNEDTPGGMDHQGTWSAHVHFRNIWLMAKK